MPTIFIAFGIRFYFFTQDHEPIHIHIENADGKAKYEIIDDVKLISNTGIKDLRIAESLIEKNKELLIRECKKTFNQ